MGRRSPHEEEENSHEEALLQDEGLFNYRDRPMRDVGWLIAYLLVLLATAAGGVYSVLHRNTEFAKLIAPEYLNDPAHCPLPQNHRRALLSVRDEEGDVFQIDLFLRVAGAWIVVSCVGSLLLGLAFLALVRSHPYALVVVAMALQVLVPVGVAGVSFAYGAVPAGVMLLVSAGLALLVFVLWREQISLVVRLMGVAGAGLVANPAIALVALLLQVVLGVLCVPLLLSMGAAFMNGNVVYNPARATGGGGQASCTDGQGQTVLCCTWQAEPWAYGFISWASVSLLWTTALIFEVKVFTISGAIAQWYFAPAVGGTASAHGRGSATLRSLNWALSASLGSLCLGSAVLTLVSLLRQAVEKARREARNNILYQIFAMVMGCVFSLIEYLTKFATVRLAITGEPFFAAASSAVDLLKRNFMDAYGVWFLPGLVLHSCAALLSAAWGAAFSLVSYEMWKGGGGPETNVVPQPRAAAVVLGVVAFVCSWVVLAFCVSILLNVIDATFFCFAMDRDRKSVARREVHDIFVLLPSVGQVVENPDGHVAYGAPQQASV